VQMIVHVIVLLVILEQIVGLKFLVQLAKMGNHVKMDVLQLEQLLLIIVTAVVLLESLEAIVRLFFHALMVQINLLV